MSTQPRRSAAKSAVVGFLAIFVVMMSVAAAKEFGRLDHGLAKRAVAILLGVMLIGAANLIPKFHLFDAPGRDPKSVHAAERLAGWTFVLTGAAYVGVWALLPLAQVMLVSSLLSFAAFAFVGLAWIKAAASAGSTPDAALSKGEIAGRILLATALATFLWASATFLTDHLWGDAATKWLAIAYPLLIGVPLGIWLPAELKKRGSADV